MNATEALGGIPYKESRLVEPGRILQVMGVLYLHPLDVIALVHPNPHDRLEHAIAWISTEADTRVDRAIVDLTAAGVEDRLTILLTGWEPLQM